MRTIASHTWTGSSLCTGGNQPLVGANTFTGPPPGPAVLVQGGDKLPAGEHAVPTGGTPRGPPSATGRVGHQLPLSGAPDEVSGILPGGRGHFRTVSDNQKVSCCKGNSEEAGNMRQTPRKASAEFFPELMKLLEAGAETPRARWCRSRGFETHQVHSHWFSQMFAIPSEMRNTCPQG